MFYMDVEQQRKEPIWVHKIMALDKFSGDKDFLYKTVIDHKIVLLSLLHINWGLMKK